jgi:phenylalanyl-tRNA synthetase beta chain
MRASVSWVAEHVDLPADLSARELGDALVRVGLEVERVESAADGITGPIVVGRVLSFDAEPQKNGKVIRWCSIDVGADEPRGIVCGADNFAVDDLVVAALPGAVLPGPSPIAARKTYGHFSDGMLCSAPELGLGDDHAGILILDKGVPGADALELLGMDDAVLDIAVTPDRGYCLSVRGLAREAAVALDVDFHDIDPALPEVDGAAYPVAVAATDGCPQFSVRTVSGLDAAAASPEFMTRRLRAAGMRSISLAVDVTNYVMLETGQPLHAFDRSKLSGGLGVRHALAAEKLTTLDGVTRSLTAADLVVTDDTGPIALAGVMGGASTEIDSATTDIVLEAALWDSASVSRTGRRHKLSSEAAKRFERGVDPAIAGPALQRCVELLVEHGGAKAEPGFTVVGAGPIAARIVLSARNPAEVAGMEISSDEVSARLIQVGCEVEGDEVLLVRPPSWRPDLIDPADLVEEVIRLVGYSLVPSVLPSPPPGGGLTGPQRLRRTVSRALAAAGYTEVISYPFVSPTVHDSFGLTADDPRRQALRLANPLSDAEPELRTSLLPGLLAGLTRNIGRSNRDLAMYEMGLVYTASYIPFALQSPSVSERPSDAELSALYASVPDQPRHVAVVLAGGIELPGWWGPGREANWADAVAAAHVVATAAGASLTVRAGALAPWHPGRCASLLLGDDVIGTAGELHPRVVQALQLPPRTCAMELNLDSFGSPPIAIAPSLTAFPPVLLDIALVVAHTVSAAELTEAVRSGAGPMLESLRLFDVFTDTDRLGAGRKSVAFACKFRAPDRTLTVDEAVAARDLAIENAHTLLGAQLRS